MEIIYSGYISTARNINYVNITAYTDTPPFGIHRWNNTHVVNFGLNYQYCTDTFPIKFGDNRNLYIKLFTHNDPPTGQDYKMGDMSLHFTRIA